MKNKSVIAATLLLIVVLAIVFTGCGETADLTEISKKIEEMQGKIEGLEQENDGLGSQVSDLQSDVESLGERVKKLESSVNLINTLDKRISALEAAGGDATQFEQLKIQVQNLQADLIANKASDDAIKAQATQMQLKLDEIYAAVGKDNTFGEVLNTIQSDITALYGEVDRSVLFENGKEYEVKLNGVVYYTIAITLEYHKDRVQSEQDIKECFSSGLHWCGRIDISNHTEIALDEMKASNIIKPLLDGKTRVAFGIYTKKGQGLPEEESTIPSGAKRSWYFTIDPIATNNGIFPKDYMDLAIEDRGNNIKLLVLEKIWDGVQEPIIGEVV